MVGAKTCGGLWLLILCIVMSMYNNNAKAANSENLDQSAVSLNTTSGWAIGNQNNWMAQTFTAGRTGLLTGVGVEVYQSSFLNESLYLQLFETNNDIPIWKVLYEARIPAANIPVISSGTQTVPLTFVDVSAAGFWVNQSGVYAIGLYRVTNNPSMPPWMIWVDAPYTSGHMYKALNNVAQNSLGFQTFVAVPEPGSLGLLAFGYSLLLRTGKITFVKARRAEKRTGQDPPK